MLQTSSTDHNHNKPTEQDLTYRNRITQCALLSLLTLMAKGAYLAILNIQYSTYNYKDA